MLDSRQFILYYWFHRLGVHINYPGRKSASINIFKINKPFKLL